MKHAYLLKETLCCVDASIDTLQLVLVKVEASKDLVAEKLECQANPHFLEAVRVQAAPCNSWHYLKSHTVRIKLECSSYMVDGNLK